MIKAISYLLALFSPVKLSDAVNEASDPTELDERVLELAGLKNGKT